jgi:endonuclease YncB( thermonuclease family)
MKHICLALLLFLFQASYAQSTITGRAIRILDGDTFEILVNDKATYKIRLTDIDAPEKKQDFGTASKQQLATYIFGREVKVVYDKLDRNQRILGHVYCQNEYINLKMVTTGMAWHFKKYSTDATFALAQQQARKAKKGLWIQPNPIAPWDFRAKKKLQKSL